MIGKVLGNYRITEEIGSGGMGLVFGAEHLLLGKRAAVKVLKPERCETNEIVERFFNEARAASMIKDLGIPEIFDYGLLPEGNAYLVMELLEGQTLGQLLDERIRIGPGRAISLTRHIAGTLKATHAKGIIHRDLKPDNIFIVKDPAMPRGERTKILDFGIAKLQSDVRPTKVQTETGRLMGTPYYMSPEQCRGSGDVDHRTDIYSLGCVMFQMISGRPPFTMKGSGEVLAAHIHLAPPPLSTVEPSVPRDLEDLVMDLLEKDPDRRPQTMQDVIDRLNGIASFAGIATPNPEPSLAESNELPLVHTFDQDETVDEAVAFESQPTTTLGSSSGEHVAEGMTLTDFPASARRGNWLRFAAPAILGVALVGGVWGAMRGLGDDGTSISPPPAQARQVTAPTPAPKPEPLIVRELVEIPAEIKKVALTVDSQPQGARVYRESDGVLMGRTPVTVEVLQGAQSVTFLLRKSGYHTETVEFAVSADDQKVIPLRVRDGASAADDEEEFEDEGLPDDEDPPTPEPPQVDDPVPDIVPPTDRDQVIDPFGANTP